jgi:transposase-like protein
VSSTFSYCRWPEGYVCELCGSKETWYMSSRRSFRCQHCNNQRSITADTLFHASHKSLLEWFLARYLVTESKKGISAVELAHHLGMRDSRRAARMKKTDSRGHDRPQRTIPA